MCTPNWISFFHCDGNVLAMLEPPSEESYVSS